MYVPKSFLPSSIAEVKQLITDFPLAALITRGERFPLVTHVPLILDEEPAPGAVLLGHMARANPHWREVGQGTPALAVFHGENHYVSPSWYPGKQEHGRVVPTWNYTIVHISGTLEVITDTAELLPFVEALTRRMESGRAQPWKVDDAPREYIEKSLAAIVGCRLVIERVEASWKLSQNRNDRDYEGVRAGLFAEGTARAEAVARNMPERDQAEDLQDRP